MISNLKRSSLDVNVNHIKQILYSVKFESCLKFFVFIVCYVIVILQLKECWSRVNNPPVITHTKLTLNESVSYPALTLCREPPYNKRFYKRFNFSGLHLGPYPLTSHWKDFPYHISNISEFWEVAVYNKSVITCYGLSDLLPHEIDLQSSIHYRTGMCHTLRPKESVPAVGKKPGYKILLMHDLFDHNIFIDDEPGWHVYVHEVNERFSENMNIHSGGQAHIFVPAGEKVEASLDVYQFNSVQNCRDDPQYSLTECEEKCWVNDISQKVNCSGPWFSTLDKPYCNEANGMIDLVKATLLMNATECCQKSCRTSLYKTSIVKRTPYPNTRRFTSGVWIYFTSKAVVTVAEKYAYDWNVFIADLGGSIGFLLGLSVIGIIGYLEKIIHFIVKKLRRKEKHFKNIIDTDKSPYSQSNVFTVLPYSK